MRLAGTIPTIPDGMQPSHTRGLAGWTAFLAFSGPLPCPWLSTAIDGRAETCSQHRLNGVRRHPIQTL
jgi:hypothetical protein